MARESDSSRRQWTEEDEQWARISRNRDFGIPPDYDEATGTCEGEEVCGERAWVRRPADESRDRPRYPRIFDPARMDFERSRYRFDTASRQVGSERGYGYESRPLRREETREPYRGMGRFMDLWVERGPFSGRGPKGYRRSDERVQEDVCEALTRDGWVDASDVEVRVDNGDVILMGSVSDREMKRAAEDAVIGIPGVRDVHNQLNAKEVGQGRQQERHERGREPVESPERTSRATGAEPRPRGPEQRSSPESAPGTSRAPRPHHPALREGMDVVDMRGNFIGRVKAVRESDFLVDRRMARDLYVPNSTVRSAENQIVLNVDEGQLENMDLPKPDILS